MNEARFLGANSYARHALPAILIRRKNMLGSAYLLSCLVLGAFFAAPAVFLKHRGGAYTSPRVS
jgi:hypothetical protein